MVEHTTDRLLLSQVIVANRRATEQSARAKSVSIYD